MKKYSNTNSEGLCTVKNPYKWPTIEWINWNNENLGNLPLYTPSGHLVKDAENVEVEGPVWQYLSHDWTTGKNVQSWVDGNDGDKPFLTYNSYAKYWNERKFDTRQIYRLLTVPPTESEEAKIKDASHYKILGNLPGKEQDGINHTLLDLWGEVENFYGDPHKVETGRQLLLRLQQEYIVKYANTDPAPAHMSSKGIKSAENSVVWAAMEKIGLAIARTEHSKQFLRGAEFGAKWQKENAKFATEAGINDIEERLTEKTSSLKGCTKNEREYFIGGGEYVLSLLRESPSNNSSSEMVEGKP